jgi:hypothetical protein
MLNSVVLFGGKISVVVKYKIIRNLIEREVGGGGAAASPDAECTYVRSEREKKQHRLKKILSNLNVERSRKETR